MVKVYPNPANDILFIEFEIGIEVLEFNLSNTLGQSIHLKEAPFVSNGIYQFDLGTYPNSIYFLNVKTNKGNFVQKIYLNN